MTSEWLIERVDPSADGKSIAHWRVNATDGIGLATAYGTEVVSILVDETTTEADVVAAVHEAMGVERVIEIEDAVLAELEANASVQPPVTFNPDGTARLSPTTKA